MRGFISSTLGIFVSLLSFAPTAVDSHGVEVRHCITPDGNNIRIFIEHWHNVATEVLVPDDAGEVDITDNVAGTSALYNPTGLIIGVLPGNLWMDGRCRENFSTLDSQCDSPPVPTGFAETNNWVYYDFPFTCDEWSSYTINKGLTKVLEDGCESFSSDTLYPALIEDTFPCECPLGKGINFDITNPEVPGENCKDIDGICVSDCDPSIFECIYDNNLCALDIIFTDPDKRCACQLEKETKPPTRAPSRAPIPTDPPTEECPLGIGLVDTTDPDLQGVNCKDIDGDCVSDCDPSIFECIYDNNLCALGNFTDPDKRCACQLKKETKPPTRAPTRPPIPTDPPTKECPLGSGLIDTTNPDLQKENCKDIDGDCVSDCDPSIFECIYDNNLCALGIFTDPDKRCACQLEKETKPPTRAPTRPPIPTDPPTEECPFGSGLVDTTNPDLQGENCKDIDGDCVSDCDPSIFECIYDNNLCALGIFTDPDKRCACQLEKETKPPTRAPTRPPIPKTKRPTLTPTLPPTPTDPPTEECPLGSGNNCKDIDGDCVSDCDPSIFECIYDNNLCALGIFTDPDKRCACQLKKETNPPTRAPTEPPTCSSTNSPSISPTPCTATGGYPLIAGHNPRTDATECLNWDLIQHELEDIMQDESCPSLANGNNFYLTGAGTYFQNIPSYTTNKATVYKEYTKYYDTEDFLQIWIEKAFQNSKTNFARGNANFGFGVVFPDVWGLPNGQCVGYVEAIEKATAYTGQLVNSYQYVQKAIDFVQGGCYAQDDNCDDAIEAIDCAVAAYVGSLEGTHGNNHPAGDYGKGPYALADKRCHNYHNCGPNRDSFLKDDTSPVNTQIMSLFAALSSAAWVGDARLLEIYLRLLSNKSIIPLLQGTYRSYYLLSNEQLGSGVGFSVEDKYVGRGGGYIFGALPKLWACSKKGEQKAYEQSKLGYGGPAGFTDVNFQAIKLAFECNYKCLGIRCEEVGSLYEDDTATSPMPGAAACDDEANGSEDVCDKPKRSRRQACKLFTGQPGIKGRNKLKFTY